MELLLLLTTFIAGTHTLDFCYDEEYCSSYSWGVSFPSCQPVLNALHSPIDLDGAVKRNDSLEALQLLGFDRAPLGNWTLKNNGHTIVMELAGGLQVKGGGLPSTYRTLQLHFHWGSPNNSGSEHTVNGKRYPMEMHIVSMKTSHSNLTSALLDSTGLAVLGVFIDVTDVDNDNFSAISSLIPSVAYRGKTVSVSPFPLQNLLPGNLSQYYRYHGSLTTPPCSQAVVWTLYEVPLYVSRRQMNAFTSAIYLSEEGANKTLLLDNFRHIHETYNRGVFASRDATPLSAAILPNLSLAIAVLPLLVAMLL